jgi:DNA-binding beta-propeller fold protein YncE
MAETKAFRVIAALVFLGVGCTPPPPTYKAALEREGELHLYLQPLPQKAQGLEFSIAAASAIREDDAVIQLHQFLTELKGRALVGVQKRFASAPLPPGSYKGISVQIGTASLLGEEGMASLLVPDDPLFIEQEFTVTRRRASTLFLSLDPERLVSGGIRFVPRFFLTKPRRQLESLLGFATNSRSNVVSVFNKFTMEIVDTIATSSGPKGAVLDQRRGWVYIAVAADDAIEAIEVGTGEILRRVRLHAGDEPGEIALSADGEILVSANTGSRSVSVVETSSLGERGRVSLATEPTSVLVGRAGRRAYVLQAFANAISVIDLGRMELTATRAFDESPVRGAISKDGDLLFVITRNSPNLLVIDAVSLTLIERIFVGMQAASVKVDPKTGLIYVGKRTGTIEVIDPSSLMPIDRFRVGGDAVFLAIDNDENTLLAVLPDRKTIQKLNLISKRLMGVIEVQEGSYAVVLMGER